MTKYLYVIIGCNDRASIYHKNDGWQNLIPSILPRCNCDLLFMLNNFDFRKEKLYNTPISKYFLKIIIGRRFILKLNTNNVLLNFYKYKKLIFAKLSNGASNGFLNYSLNIIWRNGGGFLVGHPLFFHLIETRV
jgi:hypothetical protein